MVAGNIRDFVSVQSAATWAADAPRVMTLPTSQDVGYRRDGRKVRLSAPIDWRSAPASTAPRRSPSP